MTTGLWATIAIPALLTLLRCSGSEPLLAGPWLLFAIPSPLAPGSPVLPLPCCALAPECSRFLGVELSSHGCFPLACCCPYRNLKQVCTFSNSAWTKRRKTRKARKLAFNLSRFLSLLPEMVLSWICCSYCSPHCRICATHAWFSGASSLPLMCVGLNPEVPAFDYK